MAEVTPSPSVVPSETVYVVLDDFGKHGRAYRETDEKRADLESLIEDFLSGEFSNPVRVVAFNTTEGWARDVSEDIAWKVLNRTATEGHELPRATREFAEFHVGRNVTLRAENAVL